VGETTGMVFRAKYGLLGTGITIRYSQLGRVHLGSLAHDKR